MTFARAPRASATGDLRGSVPPATPTSQGPGVGVGVHLEAMAEGRGLQIFFCT